MSIGIENSDTYSSNILIVNYNTTFNSNISVLNNIFLSGTILSISDCNLKTNIHKIENSLSKIETISGYTYTRTDTGNIETGLIAQEVLKILPEVINYNTNNNYTISYGNMCGILVECIKELNQKIKKLTDRIEKIETN
jgi:predicted KAP-like P-loop ATPase